MADSWGPVELFGMRVAHIGVNTDSPEEAERVAALFCDLLGLGRRQTDPVSTFAGTLVEVMNNGGRGRLGHIGLHVDDMAAAERWFAGRGVALNEATRLAAADGTTRLIYLSEEVAGFAVHLTTDD